MARNIRKRMNPPEWNCAEQKNTLCKKEYFYKIMIMTGSVTLGEAYEEVTESADLLRKYMERVAPVIRTWGLDN